jgi:predicted outer membrane repeat protein
MKRLLTALFSATLIATIFAGTPAPTFASAPENYYIGYGGPSDTGCGEPDFVVDNANDTLNPNTNRLEDKLQLALDAVDDGDTIIICGGWYTLHSDMPTWDGDQDDSLAVVDPINITIRGAGVNETVIDGTIDGKNYDSYTVNAFKFSNTNLTVSDLTITQVDGDHGAAISLDGGDLTIDNVNFDTYALDYDTNSKSTHYGGAVSLFGGGNLVITDSNFDATTGWDRPDGDLGDLSPVQGSGGAIFSTHSELSPNTITITGTTFSGNSADTNGGAIWAYCADATITDSEFYDNTTGSKGGAIMVKSDGDCTGDLSVVESTFEGNRTLGYFGSPTKWRHMGGAIYSVGQDMTVTDSNFGDSTDGNRAYNGGAIAMFDSTTGVATLTVTDTNFTDNYSPWNGGAIWLACVDATITGDADGTWDDYLGGTSSTFLNNFAESGGAIYLYGDGYDDNECPDGSQGSLTVEGVAFDDNEVDYQGGAIHTQQSDVALDSIEISNSVFYSNRANTSSGGALNADNVDVTVDHSLFVENSADGDGGALEVSGVVSDSNLVITNSEFSGNNTIGGLDGGAIAANELFSMSISGSRFVDNESEDNGGAIDRRSGSIEADEISSTYFYSNESGDDEDGGAIWTDQTTGITNSTFDDNTTGMDGEGGAIYSEAFLTVIGSRFNSNYSWYYGGAINADGDGLIVTDSTFTNNESRWDEGGAIYANLDGEECPTDTCATVRNSVFRFNEAEGGGAIYASDSIAIIGSTFEYNNVSDDGGAVEIYGEDALIQSSVFRSNSAFWDNGGAVNFCTDVPGFRPGHTLSVENSTFHDNSSGFKNKGGDGDAEGGAINTCNTESHLTVSRSTFTANKVDGSGGAIQVEGIFRASGNVFSRNLATVDGGAIHAQDSVQIISNTIRHNVAEGFGGGVFMDDVDQASVFSRNLVDANTADWGGGVYIYGSEAGSGRMAILTNSIWNNVATYDGGGLLIDFTAAGALYELANNVRSNTFVKNRASYGAAGVNYVSSVTKATQRTFSALVKSSKYQLNKSTIRGADKLMLKAGGPM